MIKSAYFPGKEFATKQELFSALRNNVEKIISLKKMEIYKSLYKGYSTDSFLFKDLAETVKVGPHMKDNYIYPVINTTRYMDSHDDVHLDGIWDRSVKEQQGKLFYVADHSIEIGKIIAWPEDVTAMVKTIPWTFVGKDYTGSAEALIYEINKEKIVMDAAKQIITEKRPVQNSVRMQYVTIKMGMNSDAKEDIEYRAYYDKHVNTIVNKEVAEARGYFFGIEEAKIIKEGSMVILGSNDATAIRQKEEIGTTVSTEHKSESAAQVAQKTKTIFINPNLY